MSLTTKIFKRVGLAIWLALPIFLLIQPADYFDHGMVICPSKRFLDMECPGCGLTRAVQHALHFDFVAAWEFNKGIVVVLPVLILIYIRVLGHWLDKDWLGFMKKYY